MVIDSYERLKQMIAMRNEEKPTLLLHCCCAPCSSYVLDLLKMAFDITMYYYNPNIFPEQEYQERFLEFEKLGLYKIVKADYVPSQFDAAITGLEHLKEGSERCFSCYRLRLEQAAIYAFSHSFDYFSTVLSISPYKNSDKINEIGQELAQKYGVLFLYSNFKKEEGYKKSILFSKSLGLYRQEYCGCKYSLIEARQRRKDKKV